MSERKGSAFQLFTQDGNLVRVLGDRDEEQKAILNSRVLQRNTSLSPFDFNGRNRARIQQVRNPAGGLSKK